ncbi:MAG: hypothetical protein WB523_03270 [Candidatus Sulfotelmatobacter sp.]
MKNSRFNKGLAFNLLSLLLVASTTLAVQSVATASDANDQSPKDTLHQESDTLNHADDYETTSWDRDLRFDRFDGARFVESQFAPAPYCYTFAGPVCTMNQALPAGYSCSCPNPYGGPRLPGITGF